MAEAAKIHPVVICGGAGTRLWPLSRKSCPKQFNRLFEGGSLFQRTLGRIKGAGYADPIILTHQDFRFIAADQLADCAIAATRIIVEPEARNTAPAIALAALEIAASDPAGLLLVLPSDHVLGDLDAFHRAVAAGTGAACDGALVTFGVTPDRPETGYGYIELEAAHPDGPRPFLRFVEKPDAERAAEMVESGRFLWNSGMFLFSAAAILKALEAHAPGVLEACRKAREAGRDDLCFFRPGEAAYLASPNISIDYAVMERVAGVVVPLDCGWNDLGTWQTVWAESNPDRDGVAATGGAIAIDCRDSLLRADDPGLKLVGIGLERIVAVATRDAVLVAHMDRAQEVGRAVEALRAEGAPQATEFPRSHRPWGYYEIIARGSGFQVKQLVVKPGGKLSLQSHRHRAEHWVVVAGTARITIGDEVKLLGVDQSAYIPLGAVHRLENPGQVELRLIEVQSGACLGEDDIVRHEGVYARG